MLLEHTKGPVNRDPIDAGATGSRLSALQDGKGVQMALRVFDHFQHNPALPRDPHPSAGELRFQIPGRQFLTGNEFARGLVGWRHRWFPIVYLNLARFYPNRGTASLVQDLESAEFKGLS